MVSMIAREIIEKNFRWLNFLMICEKIITRGGKHVKDEIKRYQHGGIDKKYWK
jgi:hypothetical protein